MVFKGNRKFLCHRIKFEIMQFRQQDTGKTDGIHNCIVRRKVQVAGIFGNKTSVKPRVVRHKDTSLTES